jgi:hypothetical protein
MAEPFHILLKTWGRGWSIEEEEEDTTLAEFFSQNFHRDSRQVCRPSAKIADKLMLYFTK